MSVCLTRRKGSDICPAQVENIKEMKCLIIGVFYVMKSVKLAHAYRPCRLYGAARSISPSSGLGHCQFLTGCFVLSPFLSSDVMLAHC